MTADWQDVSTAPEGEVVLVYDDGYIGKAVLTGSTWLDVEAGYEDSLFVPAPSHWTRLPEPPI